MSLWDDLSKDYRVMIWAAFVIIALIFIATPLPGYVGLNHGLKYGLDLEGGSWLQLQLQGAMVQLDVSPEKILEKQFNASSVQRQGSNYIINTKDPVPATLLDDLGYTGAKGEGTTKITIPATPEGVIIDFLQKSLDTDVKIVPESSPLQYEIRTNVTRESLNQLLAPVGGSVPTGEKTFVEGVTADTVDQTKSVLDAKLNRLGLQDIKVRIVGQPVHPHRPGRQERGRGPGCGGQAGKVRDTHPDQGQRVHACPLRRCHCVCGCAHTRPAG